MYHHATNDVKLPALLDMLISKYFGCIFFVNVIKTFMDLTTIEYEIIFTKW